ncbi:MAG: hypothetical protein Q9166_006647 [cf. Caloplaca sp. 2 TL-2023]
MHHHTSLQDPDINQWRQDVADTIRHRKPRNLQASNSSSRILRSSRQITRPGLAEISGNRQNAIPDTQNTNRRAGAADSTRKRKRNMSTNRSSKQNEQDVDWTPGLEARRGKPRGRPPLNRNIQSTRATTQKIALNNQGQPQGSVRSSTGSRSRSRSRNPKTMDQPASTTSIELRFLESCDPSVKQRMPERVRAEYNSIPEEANNLLKALREVPTGVIPSTLEALYESEAATPRKTRDAPLKNEFMPDDNMSYPPGDLGHMKRRVDRVLNKAAWNHRKKVHEGQWGAVAHSLLEELALWPVGETLTILNTERCTINPVELHTVMPNGKPLLATDSASIKSRSSKAEKSEADDSQAEQDPTVSKIVDWCLGLELDWEDETIINRAFSTVRPNMRSLNQSLSFIDQVPIFLDIEIKKTNPGRDPEVQLAIWACAALKKKREMTWDTSMPMPGIVIEGHNWSYYVFVEIKKDLVCLKPHLLHYIRPVLTVRQIMIGPHAMGSTLSLVGVWTIVYRLNLLMEWGTTTYKKWFADQVMTWAKERIRQIVLEDEAEALTMFDTLS